MEKVQVMRKSVPDSAPRHYRARRHFLCGPFLPVHFSVYFNPIGPGGGAVSDYVVRGGRCARSQRDRRRLCSHRTPVLTVARLYF
jgi:hypothetical protein